MIGNLKKKKNSIIKLIAKKFSSNAVAAPISAPSETNFNGAAN